MAIGQLVTPATVNSRAGLIANQVRAVLLAAREFYRAVSYEMDVAGLEALGFTAEDAAAMKTASDYLGTLAGVYLGEVQQGGTGGTGAILFNFDDALKVLRGVGG